MQVLIETRRDRKTGLLKGFARNYIPVLCDGDDTLMNREAEIEAGEVRGDKVFGRVF
jgi:hypothetical protein